MPGEKDLDKLVKNMQPELRTGDYIFSSIDEEKVKSKRLNPVCTFIEREGLSVILRRKEADKNAIPYNYVFRMITLNIHSSLDAVGFLAKITNALAENNISVNPVSAFYHDHLFVPAADARKTMMLLEQLSK
jgi:uncharacterized protein